MTSLETHQAIIQGFQALIFVGVIGGFIFQFIRKKNTHKVSQLETITEDQLLREDIEDHLLQYGPVESLFFLAKI